MKKIAVVVCAMFGLMIPFYMAVLPVRAASIDVTTGAEFTSAVAAAASGDTINVTADITIAAEVMIDKSLAINGNGHILSVPVPGLTDSGVYSSNPSAFRALSTNISGGAVAINDLTIKGGESTNFGAGINNNAGTILRLTGVSITNSRCDGSGGGLYNNGGIVYLIDSSISRNASANGGGFRNYDGGTMYIENSTISENRSTAGNGGGGAGENNSFLYINNSTFANNKSTELGGGINNNGGDLFVLNSTFTGNVAYNPSFGGGALAMNGDATAKLVNSVFAYNYQNSGTFEVPVYDLNDIFRYSWGQNNAEAYHCVLHVFDGESVTTNATDIDYEGAANGSDDTIFSGGAATKVLGPDGAEIGAAMVYQPYLVKTSGAYVPTAALKTESVLIGQGVKTGFSDIYESTVVGYQEGLVWENLVGDDAGSFEVLEDQNHADRNSPPAIGALESGTGVLFMLKVNSATGGTVNGGSVYGDVYASGTSVTLTGLASDGYSFTLWDYILGGAGTASISNPYSLTLSQNTTLSPVFTAISGYTVTYIGNGNTSGTVPGVQMAETDATTTISGQDTLVKSGYGFSGWNTRADGSGTDYMEGSTYTSTSSNLVLYAQYQLLAPEAPTDAIAFALSSTSLGLSWTDNSITETGFEFGISEDGINCTVYDSTDNTSTSLTGLSANTEYRLCVAAKNEAGRSAYVMTSGTYTLATLPTAVSATANDSTSITVSWSGGTASVHRASYVGGNSGWITASSYRFNGLTCNTAYVFSVKGRNGDGVEMDGWFAVSGTTLACGGAFTAPAGPDVSSLRISGSGGTVSLDNLPADITQFAVSTDLDFDNASWENISDKNLLLRQCAGASELYFKFRNAAGGVSEIVVYRAGTSYEAPREGDMVKTSDNFDVYIIKYINGKKFKRLILSPSVFESYQHLKWENIKIISQAQIDQYTTSILAKETNDTVIYELNPLGDTGEKKPLVISNYDADSVYEINKVDRDSYILEE